MANLPLLPQNFDLDSKTVLPTINFYERAKSTLPQVYLNAPDFLSLLKVICDAKQQIYDIIRSLVNIYNMDNSDTLTDSTPSGVYLQMLANNLSAPFVLNPPDSDQTIFLSVRNRTTFVNSRGLFNDFYRYFVLNGFADEFNPEGVKEVGNATINMTVPLPGSGVPNPLTKITYDMFRIKSAGIEININPGVIFYFGFSNLDEPSSLNPTSQGWGNRDPRGVVTGGGFFFSLS